MEEKYAVALVYSKNTSTEYKNLLRCVIIDDARSEEEALGKAIKYFVDETEGYNLSMQVIIKID